MTETKPDGLLHERNRLAGEVADAALEQRRALRQLGKMGNFTGTTVRYLHPGKETAKERLAKANVAYRDALDAYEGFLEGEGAR